MKTKQTKKDEAVERQEAYGQLSPKEKLVRLDAKLGKGKGAKRQREILAKEIKNARN